MNKFIYILGGALVGAAAGGVVSWFVANKYYEERMARETRSYKKAIDTFRASDDEDDQTDIFEEDTKEVYQQIASNYDAEIDSVNKDQPTDYTAYSGTNAVAESRNYIRNAISLPVDNPFVDEDDPERPYVIPDEDYYEDESTTKIELFLFDDLLLTDECWDPVEEPEKVIPMEALRAFVNNEDQDEIFTRSDYRDCLYSITKQGETWEEFVQNHPIIVEKG